MLAEKLRKLALIVLPLVPLCLMHAFSAADAIIDIIAGLFLLRCALMRDFSWLGLTWVKLALVWWAWLVFCSTPFPWPNFALAGGQDGFLQAVVIIRFLIFTVALQTWLFTTTTARRIGFWALALSAAWIGIEVWQQLLTGHNLFGYPRWGDGSLTGPFRVPRAGQLFAHLLFIATLPPAVALVRTGRLWHRLAAGGLIALGLVTSLLIGQRMGVVFAGLGLAVVAVYRPRLRLAAGICSGLALLMLLALPVLSPATHGKLVGETRTNLSDFTHSPYGEIFTVSTVMGLQSPVHGLGYRGYRVSCNEPRFNTGLPALGIGPTWRGYGSCSRHPQNYYFQSLTDSGFPGLLLFSALMFTWVWATAKGLRHNPEPLRVGLFTGVLTYAWPLASTDEFPSVYMLGWFFFILGFALACADIATRTPQADMLHD